MDTTVRTYKIVKGSGSGGFLCPPGHWNHTYSLEEFSGPRGRTVQGIYSIDYVDDEHASASDFIRERVQRIKAESNLVDSAAWERSVYGYFRSMYVPESGSRNASDLISHSPSNIAAAVARKVLTEAFADVIREETTPTDPHNYRNGVTGLGKRRGFEITAKADGSRVYVYALADDGTRYSAEHLDAFAEALAHDFDNVSVKTHPEDSILKRVEADMRIVPEPMAPERHAAVAYIREHFPAHEPRVDLIENPGKGYGSWPCTKCGEKVQYEAKFDAHTVVSTRIIPGEGTKWTYITECSAGDNHEVEG